MKKISFYTLTVLLSFVICSFKIETVSTSNKNQIIKIIFSNKMTFDELAKIKKDLHQKHIDLTYKMMAFDENNHLSKIDFEVNCNDGFKGGAAADHLKNNSTFGFYRDYSRNSKSPFGTGGIDQEN